MTSSVPHSPCPTCGYAVLGNRCPECGRLVRASKTRAERTRGRQLARSAILTVVFALMCALLVGLPFFAGFFGLDALAGPMRGQQLRIWLLLVLATFALYAIALLALCMCIARGLHGSRTPPRTFIIVIVGGAMYVVALLISSVVVAFFTFAPQFAG